MKLQLSALIISFSQLAKAQQTVVVGVNQECGFKTSINGTAVVPTCEMGLTCDKSNSDPNKTDQPGVCQLLVGVGEKCGGINTPDKIPRCNPGLTCVFPPEVTQIPDLQGVCQAITTSTVTPTQTSTVVYPPNPTQTSTVVYPPNPTSTVRPTQTSAVVYPTDVVVGAASGITAFGFAGIIALFL
jgi:hypothetical protein